MAIKNSKKTGSADLWIELLGKIIEIDKGLKLSCPRSGYNIDIVLAKTLDNSKIHKKKEYFSHTLK